MLLKEHRYIIENITNRKAIKLNGNCIYVDGCLHGRVVNGTFELHPLIMSEIAHLPHKLNSPMSESTATNVPATGTGSETSAGAVAATDTSSDCNSNYRAFS